MNYKDTNNKNDLILFKNRVLQEFSEMLDDEIESNQKRAANITYWIKDYKNYLKQEKTFQSKFLPRYPYGSVVEVNLGFNVGNEFGGLHYAIVLDTNDTKYKPILTVVPLSSMKDGKTIKDLHPSEVYLGNEFYLLIQLKIITLIESIQNQIEEIHADSVIYKNKLDKLNKEHIYLKECLKKYEGMKFGSYALTSQITTISKMRIVDPIKAKSPLSGIYLSDVSLEKILKRLNKSLAKI